MAKFILDHSIHAAQRMVKVDGDNSDWKNTNEALFEGEKSQAQASLRSAVDNDSVYLLIEVLDDFISKGDYATIFISPATSNDLLDDGARQIKVSYDGIKGSYVYNGGWLNGNTGARAKAASKGTISQNNDSDHGYIVELAIPRSKLIIKSGQALVNFAITNNEGGGDALWNTISTSTTSGYRLRNYSGLAISLYEVSLF